MFTVKQIFNLGSDYVIDESVKKEIILESIELLNGSILLKNAYESSDFRKIEIYGESIFINYYSGNYNKLLGKIFKELNLKNNFSSDYVKNFIDELISKIFESGIDNVKKDPLLVDIFDENFYEVIVYVPLDGIKMTKDLLTVGKINLREFTANDAEFHNKNIEHLMIINPHHTAVEKKYLIERCSDDFENLVGTICAEFRIYADYNTAMKKALDECYKALDIIRYAIPWIYHKDFNVFVGLKGEITRGSRNSFACKSDFKNYNFKYQRVGASVQFEISDENISIMRKIGFFKLSQSLKKSDNGLTDFERSLLIGMHWFADSQMQNDLENEFLSLMICMEIFLTPNEKDSITTFISEATALLIADLEHRKKLRDQIRGFYGIRSAIVHEGKRDIDQDSAGKLRYIVRLLLWRMIKIKDNFSSTKHLVEKIQESINNQKLRTELSLN